MGKSILVPQFSSRAVLLHTLLICLSGCSKGKIAETSREKKASENIEAVQILEHDFGVVLPKSSHKHTFKLENTTKKLWSITSVKPSCACTVGSIDSPSIPPGKAGNVTLTFTAPSGESDKGVHAAVVVSTPKNKIVFDLQLKAKVRKPASVFPKSLQVTTWPLEDSLGDKFVQFDNYSSSDWRDLSVISNVEWCTIGNVTSSRIPTQGDGQPRQRWRVPVHINPTQMKPGEYVGQVKLLGQGVPNDPLAAR